LFFPVLEKGREMRPSSPLLLFLARYSRKKKQRNRKNGKATDERGNLVMRLQKKKKRGLKV
jgi:hypothetical protein